MSFTLCTKCNHIFDPEQQRFKAQKDAASLWISTIKQKDSRKAERMRDVFTEDGEFECPECWKNHTLKTLHQLSAAREPYRCKYCGEEKKGHTCPLLVYTRQAGTSTRQPIVHHGSIFKTVTPKPRQPSGASSTDMYGGGGPIFPSPIQGSRQILSHPIQTSRQGGQQAKQTTAGREPSGASSTYMYGGGGALSPSPSQGLHPIQTSRQGQAKKPTAGPPPLKKRRPGQQHPSQER